ncbi:MAG TPA: hypothetical protein VEZ50_08495 [Nodosilinea sp.]|jgi:hypothetical protein|nr:hypothetical protein [Nodosilinea sp.]
MHPSSNRSLMTRLACAVSLGLLTTTSLGLSATPFQAKFSLNATARSEDDRGSGRLSRMPAIGGELNFRGSGRVEPRPPTPASSRQEPLAYRGSGRITGSRTT